jgi:glycyl-tRNA synthetase beta chain
MELNNLLIEIGTEELPPKSLTKLASAFALNIQTAFSEAQFTFDTVEWYASPRRLALCVKSLARLQKDLTLEIKGPSLNVAFNSEGQATPAALGWAKSNDIDMADTTTLKTDKGEWLYYKGSKAGQAVAGLIPKLVEAALLALPISKPMRWGTGSTLFIRPVHTLTMLHGSQIIDGSVLGLNSANKVFGHRFQGETSFVLEHANDYLPRLREHFVVADFTERKEMIREQVIELAKQLEATPDLSEALLEEITALVEWPVALSAEFEKSFLAVPKEALIHTMKGDQKYIPLLDVEGNLKSNFIFISNINSTNPALVITGNEKVIRPRLADAQFFFNTDKKSTLASHLESLKTVLFQKQLGTLFDKTQRISELAGFVAKMLESDPTLAMRAGLLCKTDLMTNMVMEFPDVQGVMGMHYALHDGESPEVANALNDQYLPRFAGDKLPSAPTSIALAIADKVDTLVGIFGIGQLPKGDKDPFALRRAAIGLLRIMVENRLPLDLVSLVDASIKTFGDKVRVEGLNTNVVDFVLARFKAWYAEQNVAVDVIQAVAEIRPTRPADYAARVEAIIEFKHNESAPALAAANKRVANILAKNSVSVHSEIHHNLLETDSERALVSAIEQAEAAVAAYVDKNDYKDALIVLAKLRKPIDDFFENVMVMADDLAVRNNRLSALARLRRLFLTCGDISYLNQ